MTKAIQHRSDKLDMTAYAELLETVRRRVREARVRAHLAANQELVLMYWDIGTQILQRQTKQGWGAKVIDRLATDLHRDFPDMQVRHSLLGSRFCTSNGSPSGFS